ncbi:MAG: 3-dehydroquinate synthase [Bacteroidales bacterium]|nr:3-dehydroquinate synthase [Bacteroidales bacterium]
MNKIDKIFIDGNFYRNLENFLNEKFQNSKFFILVDENTIKKCLPELIFNIPLLNNAEIIEIESGEENKTLETCVQIWEFLSEMKADRNSILINLGGGVISDMGGFIACCFKRGIKFINIPTTLLAQVDASIGGKLGVDINNFKNIVGLFSFPEAVFINTEYLKTLPEKQLLSGFAEIIKYSLIDDDENLWQIVNSISLKNIIIDITRTEIIKKSIKIKNKIVSQDPKEKNLRKVLNFGHTIGHAFETFSLSHTKNHLLHGEAVAIGLICESYLSNIFAGLNNDNLNKIVKLISSVYDNYKIDEKDFDILLDIMTNDKKNIDDNINFTLISSIGKPIINQNIEKKYIIDSLKYYQNIIV